jgi:hypothetical protein
VFRRTCGDYRVLTTFCTRAMGATGTRHFPRPLLRVAPAPLFGGVCASFSRTNVHANLGPLGPRECHIVPNVLLDRRISQRVAICWSFRAPHKQRTTMCNCTSGNLEILRCAIAHHSSMFRIAPGMTARRLACQAISRLVRLCGRAYRGACHWERERAASQPSSFILHCSKKSKNRPC